MLEFLTDLGPEARERPDPTMKGSMVAAAAVLAMVGLLAIAIGVFVMLVSPLVKKLMHLDTLRDDDVGDDLEGQREAGEPQAAGIHPTTRG